MPKKAKKEKKAAADETNSENSLPPGVPAKETIIFASQRPFDSSLLSDYEPVLVSTPSMEPMTIPTHVFGDASWATVQKTGFEWKQGKEVEISQTTASFNLMLQSEAVNSGLKQVQLKREAEAIQKLKTFKRGNSLESSLFIFDYMRSFPRSLPVQVYACRALSFFMFSNVATKEDCKKSGCDCVALFIPKRGDIVLGPNVSFNADTDFSKLMGNSDVSRVEFVEFGGLDLVCCALNTFFNNTIMLTVAFDLLSQLSIYPGKI